MFDINRLMSTVLKSLAGVELNRWFCMEYLLPLARGLCPMKVWSHLVTQANFDSYMVSTDRFSHYSHFYYCCAEASNSVDFVCSIAGLNDSSHGCLR